VAHLSGFLGSFSLLFTSRCTFPLLPNVDAPMSGSLPPPISGSWRVLRRCSGTIFWDSSPFWALDVNRRFFFPKFFVHCRAEDLSSVPVRHDGQPKIGLLSFRPFSLFCVLLFLIFVTMREHVFLHESSFFYPYTPGSAASMPQLWSSPWFFLGICPSPFLEPAPSLPCTASYFPWFESTLDSCSKRCNASYWHASFFPLTVFPHPYIVLLIDTRLHFLRPVLRICLEGTLMCPPLSAGPSRFSLYVRVFTNFSFLTLPMTPPPTSLGTVLATPPFPLLLGTGGRPARLVLPSRISKEWLYPYDLF